MENFQLYRTNLLLGGQLKWDLIIENSNNGLYIKDFHLSPISNNIPYTYQSDEQLLNNSHQDNVMLYYKKIKGYFYNEGLSPEFNHNYPIIVKSDEYINPYSNIYDMGCKRMKNYKLYNKQFEFFCPVWIEQLKDYISFKFTVKKQGNNSILATHTLSIKPTAKKDFHNKFVNYFKNYINAAGISSGTDNLLNIQLNNESFATGLNVNSGLFDTKNVTSIINNLTSRERPVIEADNMLINCFCNNDLICKQLYNFNFCFNLNDIMSNTTAKLLKGQPICVSVDVIIDDIVIEKRDFDYNYEYSLRTKYYDDTITLNTNELNNLMDKNPDIFKPLNVYDHLYDSLNVELKNFNKYCPKVCHWCLCDYTDYIFNLYKGFEGYGIIKEQDNVYIVENEHQYSNTPNTTVKEYNLSLNNAGWINTETINYWGDFYKFIQNTEKYKKEKATYINGNKYVNGLKYKYLMYDTYLIGLKVSNKIYSNIEETYKNDIDIIDKNNHVIIYTIDNLTLLISNSWNSLTFAGFYEMLYTLSLKNTNFNCTKYANIKVLNELFTMMKSVQPVKLVLFDGTIEWKYVEGPSKDVKEVEYYKSNNKDYVLRYDGNIKPLFVKEPNIIYYKDYVSDNRTYGKSKLQNSIYAKYINSGYEPVYSSIGYNACKSCMDYNWNEIPHVNISEHNITPLINSIEYSWFNNGAAIFITPEIKFTYTNKRLSPHPFFVT